MLASFSGMARTQRANAAAVAVRVGGPPPVEEDEVPHPPGRISRRTAPVRPTRQLQVALRLRAVNAGGWVVDPLQLVEGTVLQIPCIWGPVA
jgi:hypothetical protein